MYSILLQSLALGEPYWSKCRRSHGRPSSEILDTELLSNIVSLISVIAALAAVGISAWQVRASLRSAERSNAIPIISGAFQEFRSADFRESVSRLLLSAPRDAEEGGFDALEEGVREDAYRVCYFFDYLGTLTAFNIISEELIISVMGNRPMQVWSAMSSVIDSERRHRIATYPADTPTGFLVFYEHLVTRIIESGGKEAAREIQKRIGVRAPSAQVSSEIQAQTSRHFTEKTANPDE